MNETTKCHPASAVRTGATSGRKRTSSDRKRAIQATLIDLAVAAGHSDGETYVDCVACGKPASLTIDSNLPMAFNAGHMQADAHGGAFCPCNLQAMHRKCNVRLGDRNAADVFTARYDTRAAWSGILSAPRPLVRTDDTREEEWLPPSR